MEPTGTPQAEPKDRAEITVADLMKAEQEASDVKTQTDDQTTDGTVPPPAETTNGEAERKPIAPDETILKALEGNDAAIKRLNEQFAGLEKLRNDYDGLKAVAEEQAALQPTIDVMLSYHQAFENPETVREAAQKLVADLAKAHKMTVEDLLDLEDPDDTRPDYVKAGFNSRDAFRAYQAAEEAKAIALKNQEGPQSRNDVGAVVDRVYTQLVETVQKDCHGFKPSKDQVRQAFEALPGVAKDDPVKAVDMFFSSEIRRLAIAEIQKKEPGNFPQIGKGVQSGGAVNVPSDRAKWRIADLLAAEQA